MEAASQCDAERKFWATPELLETLFSWLDLESTLNLARVVDKESLQNGITSKVWNKLIRYNCPLVERDDSLPAVKALASILKLMNQPKDLLLDLLDVTCEEHPAHNQATQLQMICPRHLEP